MTLYCPMCGGKPSSLRARIKRCTSWHHPWNDPLEDRQNMIAAIERQHPSAQVPRKPALIDRINAWLAKLP